MFNLDRAPEKQTGIEDHIHACCENLAFLYTASTGTTGGTLACL